MTNMFDYFASQRCGFLLNWQKKSGDFLYPRFLIQLLVSKSFYFLIAMPVMTIFCGLPIDESVVKLTFKLIRPLAPTLFSLFAKFL